MSGLYFRGKLAYARAFARPPRALSGIFVITPGYGLRLPEERIDVLRLREFAAIGIDAGDARYREPLVRDARALATAAGDAEVVLLGSVATTKYTSILAAAFGARLRFPVAFVGRGDMSRGGLMLRSVRAGQELEYVPLLAAPNRGRRPPRLEPIEPSATPRATRSRSLARRPRSRCCSASPARSSFTRERTNNPRTP